MKLVYSKFWRTGSFKDAFVSECGGLGEFAKFPKVGILSIDKSSSDEKLVGFFATTNLFDVEVAFG